MTPNPLLYLCDLLVSLFEADQLERFADLYIEPGLLPVGAISLEVFAYRAARALEHRGYLKDGAFWTLLVRERPRREAEIRKVQNHFMTPKIYMRLLSTNEVMVFWVARKTTWPPSGAVTAVNRPPTTSRWFL